MPWPILDSLFNLVSSLGTSKDKSTHTKFGYTELSRDQIEAAYRADWMARKIVTIPAVDATRKWRSWQAEGDTIERIEEIETQFLIKQQVTRALILSRLYGGSALILGVGDVPEEPLDVEAVGEGDLRYVHVVHRYELNADVINWDIDAETFGEPNMYQMHGSKGMVNIHPTRVVRFLGNELPDPRNAGAGWGDSVLQVIDDALKQAGLTLASTAALINEAKIDIIKIPELSEHLSTADYESRLISRFTLSNQAKSILNTLLLDKEEEHTRISTSFQSLPELMMNYLQIVSGAADIPATRFLGISPAGLSATGESDLSNYYDKVNGEQETQISPVLARLDEVLIRSAGIQDDELFYLWDSLWQTDETKQADVALKKAQATQIYVTSALLPDEALAKGVQNMLVEDGLYPGLEAALEEFPDRQPIIQNVGGVPGEPGSPSSASIIPLRPTPAQVPAVGDARRKRKSWRGGRSLGLRRSKLKSVKKMSMDMRPRRLVTDAKPRTLYVRRDVVNHAEITAWAKAQGFETTVPGNTMHVTIAFSRTPVDWMKVGSDYYSGENGQLVVPEGGPRVVEQLGTAVVLMFNQSQLVWRHKEMLDVGASWDWPDYQPHITITYSDVNAERLAAIEPYRGKLVLGPEIFEEVNEDYKDTIKEVVGA